MPSLTEQLQAWARAATDEELRVRSAEGSELGSIAQDEINDRAERAETGVADPEPAFEYEFLLTDATRLRMALQQMFSVGDVNARMEPRYRHASSVLERTEYLIGPDAPCTGNPRCDCPAHQAYEQWLADDARREQAQQSAEQAREQQPGAIRRVM